MLSKKKMGVLLATVTVVALLTVSCGGAPAGETAPTSETASESETTSEPETSTMLSSGLQVVFKDPGMPNVRCLQPTVKEIQLHNEDGSWVTIWSDPEGKTVELTPDGAEVLLDTVSLEAGTYVGTRLLVSSVYVEVDINRDGDILDENEEIILTEAEIKSLPPLDTDTSQQKPEPPEKPEEPQEPEEPVMLESGYGYRIKIDGLYYMGEYLDEKFDASFKNLDDGYIVPL